VDFLKQMLRPAKPVIRPWLRRSTSLWPGRFFRSSFRSGQNQRLASDGGTPVRNTRLRPWAAASDNALFEWHRSVGARLRQVYVSGVEGLPQPLAQQFAQVWAHYCGVRFTLLVGHGTDALRIALAAALDHDGLSYGGEVIVPNLTFIASATAALDRRLGVALVDVDPDTLLLDPARVEEAIIPGKTRAIMAVHLFGQPAHVARLRSIADKHDLKLIEDAAQAHGAAWEGKPVGGFGDAGAFSFQSSKNLSAGEGGALVTDDAALFERAYAIQNVGRSRQDTRRWEHWTLGWNCRPTEYQAALLLERFRNFDRLQHIRAANVAYLRTCLQTSRALQPLAVHGSVTAHGMYAFTLRYRPEHCGSVAVEDFLRHVGAEGVPLYRGFPLTVSDQPVMRQLREKHPAYVRVLDTPVAAQAARDTVFIPHEVFLGDRRDMEDIASAVHKVERHFSRLATTAAAY